VNWCFGGKTVKANGSQAPQTPHSTRFPARKVNWPVRLSAALQMAAIGHLAQYFDVEQLEPMDEPAVVLGFKPTGGGRPNPVRETDPKR
jgi:hypothetical protein